MSEESPVQQFSIGELRRSDRARLWRNWEFLRLVPRLLLLMLPGLLVMLVVRPVLAGLARLDDSQLFVPKRGYEKRRRIRQHRRLNWRHSLAIPFVLSMAVLSPLWLPLLLIAQVRLALFRFRHRSERSSAAPSR
jgi:hypothetical protein